MSKETDSYIHGYTPAEQERLALLNTLLNARCRPFFEVQPKSKVLDVGSGLGIFSRQLARETDSVVIGVEKSPAQIKACSSLAAKDAEADLVEFRTGSAYNLPLAEQEWNTFDLVYTRFLLEHLKDPQRAVDQMMKALKPGGQIILLDDDHANFQFYPQVAHFDLMWTTYLRSYDRLGNDPFIGRKLVHMLYETGAKIVKNDHINFGSHSDDPNFKFFADNIKEIILQAKPIIVGQSMMDEPTFNQGIEAIEAAKQTKGCAIWYSIFVAVGTKIV